MPSSPTPPADAPRVSGGASPAVLLSIAGHDPSSGAGITADLQTFAAHGFFGTSAITALTVQSTMGVAEVDPVRPTLLASSLQHLCADLPPAGIKIGMLGSAAIGQAVADFLAGIPFSASNGPRRTALLPIVLDPVLRSSSGAALASPDVQDVLHRQLLRAVTWITPNWQELAVLSGRPVGSLAEAVRAAHALAADQPRLHIVATGGDQARPTELLRLPSGEMHEFPADHIDSISTHGTGCAFSSALLCRLVAGDTPVQAVAAAKHFVAEAIRRAPTIGHGRGPLSLLWPLTPDEPG